MSHEITACRRKWQLMKSQRSRSHRRRELGSEILNTKSHFWFGSSQNSGPKLHNVWAYVQKRKRKNRKGDFRQENSCLRPGRPVLRARGAQLQPKRTDPNEMWLSHIRSAATVNIQMITAQQFGADEPDRFSQRDRFCSANTHADVSLFTLVKTSPLTCGSPSAHKENTSWIWLCASPLPHPLIWADTLDCTNSDPFFNVGPSNLEFRQVDSFYNFTCAMWNSISSESVSEGVAQSSLDVGCVYNRSCTASSGAGNSHLQVCLSIRWLLFGHILREKEVACLKIRA